MMNKVHQITLCRDGTDDNCLRITLMNADSLISASLTVEANKLLAAAEQFRNGEPNNMHVHIDATGSVAPHFRA